MPNQHLSNNIEAPSQSAAFQYQSRFALYRALKQLRRGSSGSIGVERIDDISLKEGTTITEIEQLKHTTSAETKFSNSSVAIWRTLGNWARLILQEKVNLSALDLVFITNSAFAEGSAFSMLGPDDSSRNIAVALAQLKDVATASKNQQTEKDRKSFLELDEITRDALLRAIRDCGRRYEVRQYPTSKYGERRQLGRLPCFDAYGIASPISRT